MSLEQAKRLLEFKTEYSVCIASNDEKNQVKSLVGLGWKVDAMYYPDNIRPHTRKEHQPRHDIKRKLAERSRGSGSVTLAVGFGGKSKKSLKTPNRYMRDIRGLWTELNFDMENLQKYLLNAVKTLSAEREERNMMPSGVTVIDLQNKAAADIRTALNELCKSKALEFYKTINSIAFKIRSHPPDVGIEINKQAKKEMG